MAVITQQRAVPQEAGFTGLAAASLLVGGLGALSGLGAFLAVVIGDAMIPFETAAMVSVALVVVGLMGVVIVRDLPDVAALAMAAVPFVFVFALGEKLSPWWNAYQVAVQTSGAAENVFWTSMPATALFIVSGVLFGLGAILAAFSWSSKTRA
jgi:hypothetical protein